MKSRFEIGSYGEKLACDFFHILGFKAARQYQRFIGDVKVTNIISNVSVNVEVKTAQLRKSKPRYDFTLEKTGHTSISGNVDFVLLLALTDNESVTPFLIPQSEIKGVRCISIPKSLTGKYAKYINSWEVFLGKLQSV